MALSGSLTTTSYDGRYYKFDWSATQSVDNNKSTVSWTLSAVGGSSSWYAERTLQVIKGGDVLYSKTARVERYAGTITSGSFTVSHDSSGNAKFSISLAVAVYGSDVNCTGSKTFTLNTIARVSTPTLSSSSVDFGNNITIYTNRLSNNFTHHLYYSFNGGSEVGITSGIGASYTWTVPNSLMNSIPSATSATITLRLYTFNGSTNIGSKTVSFTAKVPSSVKPSCSLAVSDATGFNSIYGAYVKGISKLKVVVTATTSYSSAIASYSTSANGGVYTSSSFTTGVITSSGTLSISSTVKDKRGRSGSASTSVSVLNYSVPNISLLKVKRCNADGTENAQGEYIQVTFSGSVTSLNNKNTAQYQVEYKKTNETGYNVVELSDYDGNYSVSNGTYIFQADTGSSYNVKVTVTDAFNTGSKTTVGSTGFAIIHWLANGLGLAFGKIAELSGVLDIGFQTKHSGGLINILLENNTDLNDIKTPNVYYGNSASTSGYLNCPISTGTSFTLEVMSAGGDGQIMQRLTTCSKTGMTTYYRFYYSSSWGDWVTKDAVG